MSFNGQPVKKETLAPFLSTPGDDLVAKTLMQLAAVPQFVKLFGPYVKDKQDQRWADYQRMDWSIRMLPCIAVFESQSEQKTSDSAWLVGNVTMHVYWPPSQRRSDLARVPAIFKGILENFFGSQFVTDMLDELYYIERPSKVFGLNEYGKEMTWTTNVEGIVESEMVPVTMVDVRYRIDLRAWKRALEYFGRTKENPFEKTLDDLTHISGEYDSSGNPIEVKVLQDLTVTNP